MTKRLGPVLTNAPPQSYWLSILIATLSFSVEQPAELQIYMF